VRRLSFVLLTIEAIALVFPTFLGAVFLVGTSSLAWKGVWDGSGIFDALIWVALFLSLVAAWWLLLAYFYIGSRGARRVPVPIWVFAGLVALLASLEFTVGGENSPLRGLAVGFLFVPTFLHLVGEVWVWRPNTSPERTRDG
jgi:hypothetical protein